jgi:hypothetical protein
MVKKVGDRMAARVIILSQVVRKSRSNGSRSVRTLSI